MAKKLPTSVEMPTVDTFEALKAFDVDEPTNDELRIEQEIEELAERLQALEAGHKALCDRHHATSQKRTGAEVLLKIGRTSPDDADAARSAEEKLNQGIDEVSAEMQAVQDLIDDAQARLEEARKARYAAYEERLKQTRWATAQGAISALYEAFRLMWDLRELNQMIERRGYSRRHDQYLYGPFFGSKFSMLYYLVDRRKDGFEVPSVDELRRYE